MYKFYGDKIAILEAQKKHAELLIVQLESSNSVTFPSFSTEASKFLHVKIL